VSGTPNLPSNLPKRVRGPVAPSTDRTVPAEYVGTLEPNYYCRAWNGKEGRKKYCRARAGARTDHPGVGRCYHHSGTKQVFSGRYSTLTNERVAPLVAAFLADPSPTDLGPEVALLRALVHDFVERYNLLVDALVEWNHGRDPNARPQRIPRLSDVAALVAEVGKMVERIEKIRTAAHISENPEFRRIAHQMALVVQEAFVGIPDATARLTRIHHGWAAIPL
jgi:hypothetical protein